jgi:hypothetical protein
MYMWCYRPECTLFHVTLLYFTKADGAMYSLCVVSGRADPFAQDAKFLLLVQFILSEVLLLTVIR